MVRSIVTRKYSLPFGVSSKIVHARSNTSTSINVKKSIFFFSFCENIDKQGIYVPEPIFVLYVEGEENLRIDREAKT